MQDTTTPYKRSFPRSTLLWAGITMLLAGITGAVVWYTISYTPTNPTPKVEGSLNLGIPGLVTQTTEGQFLARSALVYDTSSESIVFEQNGFERRPIASLTKLMTAMVAIDHNIPWDQEADIALNEYVIGGQLLLHPGEKVTMRDLFAASIVGSANNATLAYVRQLGIPEEEFIREMNRKAIELGLEQTEFTDVTGLDVENVSTAYEVARLAEVAFTQYPEIAKISSMNEYPITFRGSGRQHAVRNSNKLVSDNGTVFTGSKTGFLYEAGYCLVVRGSGATEHRIAVVLGSPSENQHFADIQRLVSLSLP